MLCDLRDDRTDCAGLGKKPPHQQRAKGHTTPRDALNDHIKLNYWGFRTDSVQLVSNLRGLALAFIEQRAEQTLEIHAPRRALPRWLVGGAYGAPIKPHFASWRPGLMRETSLMH